MAHKVFESLVKAGGEVMSMKNQIQDDLDKMVERFKKRGFPGEYLGVPLEEFTNDELMAVIYQLGLDMRGMIDRHSKDLDFMAGAKAHANNDQARQIKG